MALQWVLLLVMAFTGTVTSHRPLALGSCPTPAGMADFDKTQFFGKWNIAEVDGGINKCITQEFSAKEGSSSDIEVKQDRILVGGLQAPSVMGTLSPLDNGRLSEFTVEWLLSGRFSDMRYTLLDTDYTSYAMVYECQKIGPFRHAQGTILARPGVTLPADTTSKLKEQATSLGLDFSKLNKIKHDDCEAQTVEDAVNFFGFLNEEEAEALTAQQNTPSV